MFKWRSKLPYTIFTLGKKNIRGCYLILSFFSVFPVLVITFQLTFFSSLIWLSFSLVLFKLFFLFLSFLVLYAVLCVHYSFLSFSFLSYFSLLLVCNSESFLCVFVFTFESFFFFFLCVCVCVCVFNFERLLMTLKEESQKPDGCEGRIFFPSESNPIKLVLHLKTNLQTGPKA